VLREERQDVFCQMVTPSAEKIARPGAAAFAFCAGVKGGYTITAAARPSDFAALHGGDGVRGGASWRRHSIGR
jgi:hypothetical protein